MYNIYIPDTFFDGLTGTEEIKAKLKTKILVGPSHDGMRDIPGFTKTKYNLDFGINIIGGEIPYGQSIMVISSDGWEMEDEEFIALGKVHIKTQLVKLMRAGKIKIAKDGVDQSINQVLQAS